MTAGRERFAAYVDSELTYEWQRKSAMETRAFGIVTADLALAALFFAIADQLDLLAGLNSSPSAGLRVVATVAAASSVLLSVAAALPMKYAAPRLKAVRRLLADVESMTENDVAQEVLETRVAQLASARISNGIKAALTIAAFVAMATSAGALLGALLLTKA